jgi:hypothetical protein
LPSGGPPKHAARVGVRRRSLVEDEVAVDPHGTNADRHRGCIRRRGTIRDPLRIEQHEIRRLAGRDCSAVRESDVRR